MAKYISLRIRKKASFKITIIEGISALVANKGSFFFWLFNRIYCTVSTVCVACTVCPHSYSQLSNAIPAEQPLSAQCWERMSGMEGNGKYLGGDSYTRQESPTTIYQIVNGTDVPGTNPWPTCLRGDDVFGSQPCLVILSLSILVAGLIFLLICVTILQEGNVS